ncbi:MAG TPA: kelch repeat-containing protein, partial [Candidatus Udaeobacter sp.]|nr:kelch repeat-containing protein [Candidatus Udaeobacter sp.]
MKKQGTSGIGTTLHCLTFFAVALLLLTQVIPRALGQRHGVTNKRISGAPSHAEGGTWTETGSLNTGRFLHTATVLSNGMVLVAGGLDVNFQAIATTELYDAATGTWTATGNLNTARYEQTATLLPNGKVL